MYFQFVFLGITVILACSGPRLAFENRGHIILHLFIYLFNYFTVLGFNDKPTIVGHFVSSTREREKRTRTELR